MTVFTNEQLCELLKRGEDGTAELLLKQNKKFIKMCAKAIYGDYCAALSLTESDKDDLMQEGNLALLNAAQKYDSAKNIKFLSYASSAIKNAMMDWIRETGKRFEVKLPAKYPAYQWVNYIDELDGQDCWRIDMRDDPYAMTPEQIYLQKETGETLEAGLDKCDLRSRAYLMYRFGFDDGMEHSKKETAQRYHLKQSWARKIEDESLDYLRHYLISHGEYRKGATEGKDELADVG